MEKDISTEKLIKEAARKVFLKKGFGSARTRDIADEAGINLALLNYYFRSKQKLFDIIMEESIQELASYLGNIIYDETTTLSQKIDLVVNNHIDGLTKTPQLSLFVLNEMNSNPDNFLERSGIPFNARSSSFYRQIVEQIEIASVDILPRQLLVNLFSLIIFPATARPMLLYTGIIEDEETFYNLIEERRTLVPVWIKAMLKLPQ